MIRKTMSKITDTTDINYIKILILNYIPHADINKNPNKISDKIHKYIKQRMEIRQFYSINNFIWHKIWGYQNNFYKKIG